MLPLSLLRDQLVYQTVQCLLFGAKRFTSVQSRSRTAFLVYMFYFNVIAINNACTCTCKASLRQHSTPPPRRAVRARLLCVRTTYAKIERRLNRMTHVWCAHSRFMCHCIALPWSSNYLWSSSHCLHYRHAHSLRTFIKLLNIILNLNWLRTETCTKASSCSRPVINRGLPWIARTPLSYGTDCCRKTTSWTWALVTRAGGWSTVLAARSPTPPTQGNSKCTSQFLITHLRDPYTLEFAG